MSGAFNVGESSKQEPQSSVHSHCLASEFGESSGVLASADSHPHLISKSVLGLRQEANATPGPSCSPINTQLDYHRISDPQLTPIPILDESLPRFTRPPLHSIPETGQSGFNQLTPLLTKSRKRSSTSEIESVLEDKLPPDESEEKRRPGPSKRGRRPLKLDMKSKLEKSRQSARECRARKKLRYQYLEELVSAREKAIFALREELEMYKSWCKDMDEGKIPPDIKSKMEKLEKKLVMPGDERQSSGSTAMEDDDEDDVDSDDDDDSEEFDNEEEDEEVQEKATTEGSS